MATGSRDGQEREFYRLNQAQPHAIQHSVDSAAEKNMKEVSGSKGGSIMFGILITVLVNLGHKCV